MHGLAVRCRPGAERERTGLAGGDSRYSGNSTAVNTSGCRLGGGLGGPRGLGAGALQRAEEDFEGRGDENWRGLGRGESRAHCGIRARSSQPPTSLVTFIYLPFSNPARSHRFSSCSSSIGGAPFHPQTPRATGAWQMSEAVDARPA